MDIIPWSKRWIYKGSMTTPPCDRFVYWNVIDRVFPIKKEHVDLYKAKLAAIGVKTEGKNGNWREI